ncbi:MAG: energy transducer TonB [Chlorobiales bacterium]|nr:energy transducer TonB [Chlorobiales bacterium]
MPKMGSFVRVLRPACFYRDEYLDTERLLKLRYGNLVLRHQSHLFLCQGVGFAVVLLVLFWIVTANWDIIASGRGFSDKGSAGDSYEQVTSVINLVLPSPSVPENTTSPSLVVAEQPKVGKIIKVSQKEMSLDDSAATQQELKNVIQNNNGAGSGNGLESSGIEGLGGEGSMFGSCDKMPGFLDQIKPAYPEAARIAGITGKVFVKVLIAEDGHPMKAIVTKRIPAECLVFDGVALKSVVDSKYYPGIKNGRPVKVWCVVPISFQLN